VCVCVYIYIYIYIYVYILQRGKKLLFSDRSQIILES